MEEMYFFNWTFFVEGFLWLFHLHATTFEHRSKIMKYKRVNGGNILKNVHEGDKKCIKSKMSIKKHLVRCCFTSLFIKSICLQKDSYGHFFKIDCLATTCCTSVWIRLKSLDACGKKWEKRSPYETYIYVWSAQMGGVTMICRDGRRPIWFFPFFLSNCGPLRWDLNRWMSLEAQPSPPWQIWAIYSSQILRYLWKAVSPSICIPGLLWALRSRSEPLTMGSKL